MAIDVEFIEPDTPPSSSDAVNFRTRSDAFVAFIASFVTKLIAFVTQINSTEANINAKEASTVAAALAAATSANFKGTFVQGTSSALVGESWNYGGVVYRCLVNTLNNPSSEPASWVSMGIADQIKSATEEAMGGTDKFGFFDSLTLGLRSITLDNFKALIFASPALTGVSTAPTASVGTGTEQVSNCAFVLANRDFASTNTVLAANAGATQGGIGTYAFLNYYTANSNLSAGSLIAGSSLRYSAIESPNPTASGTHVVEGSVYLACNGTPSGTWKCMGASKSDATSDYPSTLFLRVA